MTKLYVGVKNEKLRLCFDDGGRAEQPVRDTNIISAEYAAVAYGLNEYYLRWNKELDERHSSLDPETKNMVKTISVAGETKRPLPPPVMICTSSNTVYLHLTKQIPNDIMPESIRHLAKQIWQMVKNIDIKFQLVEASENKALKE